MGLERTTPTVRSGPADPGDSLTYDLGLEVDCAKGTFRGRLGVSRIPVGLPHELDSVDLAIDAVRGRHGPLPFRIDSARGKLVLEADPASEAPLEVTFAGRAGEGVQTGLFVSRLGERRAIATQMEPEGCRRLFPCFDRPDLKAVVRLRVTTEGDLEAISNSPGRARTLPDGRREWTFAPTPPMATYLVFLAIGPFEERDDGGSAPRVIVAGPPGSSARDARALSIARKTVITLGEYFDAPYPLPKLHLVALSDFWVAMENWGAISGSEEHYLLDDTTPPGARQFGDQTIVHEISHQWFGDLVTMRSWEDLWLNESFATFVTPKVQELAGLRSDPWGEFVMFTARGDPVDSLRCTHPVKPNEIDAGAIMATADFITYFKGSRLLRMIEGYLGATAFREGLSTYLRRHRYGNASSDDLWRALEERSGRDVVRLMRTWVERPGHPVIRYAQRGPDVELVQERFLYLPSEEPEPPWPIPLTIEERGKRRSVLFDAPRLVLPGSDASSLRLDPGRTGFFRLLPEPALRRHAIERVMELPPLDRWGLLHDARAFLLSGDYALEEYEALLRGVRNATDSVTVLEVTQSLHLWGGALIDLPSFRDAAREFCRAQTERLGEEPRPGEPESTDELREWVAWKRVAVDDDYARRLAPRFERIGTERPALRHAIATAFGRSGPPDAPEQLAGRVGDPDGEAARRACRAVEGFRDGAAVARLLDRALASARLSDLFTSALLGAARNPAGRAATWDWLRVHLRELELRAQGTYLLAYALDGVLPFIGIGRETQLREYFARERFPEGHLGILSGLESLDAVLRLRARLPGGAPSPTVR